MIKFISDYLWKSHFSRYVLILTTGTFFAQLIPVLVSPVLTRLYSPEDFALLAFFLSISNIFVVIASLRYEQAIMLPKLDKNADSLMLLSFMIVLLFAFFALCIFTFWHKEVGDLFNQQSSTYWLMLVPLFVLVTGGYRVFLNWANRKKRYKSLAAIKIIQTGATATSNVGNGFLNVSGGLIISELLGHSIALGVLVYRFRKFLKRIFSVSLIRVWFNAKRFSDFAKVNTPHVLIDTLKSSGVVFILLLYFGDAVLGLYALMLRVLMAPVSLIGTSIAQVFYRQASEIHNQGGDVCHLMKQVTSRLMLFSWPFFALFMVFAPDLFQFIFGDPWRRAGNFAQILTPWLAVHFVVMPVMQLPMIYNRQRMAFIFGMIGNVLMLVSVFYGGYVDNVEYGFILLSISMVIYFSALYIWLKKICASKYSSV